MARGKNTLKELATKENIQKVLEFGEEAIDTLADVTLRLQRAYHDLLEEQPRQQTRRRTVKRKKAVLASKKRVTRV